MSATTRIKHIDSPDDADLADLWALLAATFADPNIVLRLDRMQEFLAANQPGAARRFCVLVAIDPTRDGAVIGGSVFSHVVRSNCGFSEYIVAERGVRRTGIGRLLFDARKKMLDTEARRLGHDACRGLFIEVEHPDRVPADFAAAEQQTALDAWERLRLFDHLGFRRVAVPYVQPALAPDKHAIDYMDLLFAPWQAQATARIPSSWILDTLEAIWSAWTPALAASHLEGLGQRISAKWVGLEPVSRQTS